MIMLRFVALVVIVIIGRTSAEYKWTGSAWEWQDSGDVAKTGGNDQEGLNNPSVEGSGGDPFSDDEEYDEENYDYSDETDDYDYKSNKKKNNKQHSTYFKSKNGAGTFDDEDLTEGSGAGDDFSSKLDSDDGSGDFGGYNWKDEDDITPHRKHESNSFDLDNTRKFDSPRKYEPPKNKYDTPKMKYDTPKHKYDDPLRNSFDGNIDVDDDKPMYVDSVNYNTPKEDVFFGSDNEKDDRKRVTTTIATDYRHHKPTEAPEVHREGTANHRPVSFFAQPGILAAVIGGAVVGLLCAILLVMFIVYRMRKKDEGSYALDEPKRSHNANSYSKPPSREFYA